MTTEQIQAEIDRLKNSPYVKIAKKDRAIAEACGLKIEEGGN